MRPEVRQKLKDYNELLFSVSRGFDLEQIAAGLPTSMQEEITYDMHENMVRNVPIFAGQDDNFFRVVTRHLKTEAHRADPSHSGRAVDLSSPLTPHPSPLTPRPSPLTLHPSPHSSWRGRRCSWTVT